jgi:hypothetical protein
MWNIPRTVEPNRPQMTVWRMRIICWIPKATNTHSEYVILIAFPLQQWLHERASMLRYTYIACHVTLSKGLMTPKVWRNTQIVIRNKTSADGNNVWFSTTSESSALLIPKHHHTSTHQIGKINVGHVTDAAPVKCLLTCVCSLHQVNKRTHNVEVSVGKFQPWNKSPHSNASTYREAILKILGQLS